MRGNISEPLNIPPNPAEVGADFPATQCSGFGSQFGVRPRTAPCLLFRAPAWPHRKGLLQPWRRTRWKPPRRMQSRPRANVIARKARSRAMPVKPLVARKAHVSRSRSQHPGAILARLGKSLRGKSFTVPVPNAGLKFLIGGVEMAAWSFLAARLGLAAIAMC